jgi:hypothetical protein
VGHSTMRPRARTSRGLCREASSLVRLADGDDPQLPRHDPTQQRYEILRPLVLFHERTAIQRAEEPAPHPETVGTLKRRFAAQGMLGLFPASLKVISTGRRRRVSEEVGQELQRLKGLYNGCQYRALARIIFHTLAHRLHHATGQKLWHQLPPTIPKQLPLLASHSSPARAHARLQVMERYGPGWSTRRISRFLHVSRPTLNAGMARFEAANLESLEAKSRAPQSTGRKAWLPAMVEISHLPKRSPDAGGCRLGSLRGQSDLSVRPVERIMASNRQVSKDIPHVGRKRHRKSEPGLHPCKASVAHESWCIDGRMMDCTVAGVKWWSLIVRDGYARTMLAGAVAPSEARWVAMTVLYPACLRYGASQHGMSDSGGA